MSWDWIIGAAIWCVVYAPPTVLNFVSGAIGTKSKKYFIIVRVSIAWLVGLGLLHILIGTGWWVGVAWWVMAAATYEGHRYRLRKERKRQLRRDIAEAMQPRDFTEMRLVEKWYPW